MTIVCASCQRYLGTRPPYSRSGIEPGLCSTCAVRKRRELSTLVISRERAEAWAVLVSSLVRTHPDLRVLVDRRKDDRRRESLDVPACRRGGPDRRQTRTLHVV